ncbi:CPBP family intramembrane glutamic endopeptidase [Thalassomonas sp. M1454]|uniref:CPBP family intramembrane glutamic endopeptidase n=1 Tax=Thalassomonas sp. M1454 TaxID=2594477 RepID=UPI00117F08D2|nr:CPBP family intramembrane glutamic endopeptidase [Thalassomonas sp. M1454]TRX53180.1 CPBP family intramembrane metalloprotease [Thalassomonas sp. M1454]
MSDKKTSSSIAESNNTRLDLKDSALWIAALYIPTFLLSIAYGIYVRTNPAITDPATWFSDGDIISGFGIFMAMATLPILYLATKQLPLEQRLHFFALDSKFEPKAFYPWLLVTLLFLSFWWAVNSIFNIEPPEVMLNIVQTSDYLWLLVLSICIVAPVFEELVFRGFIYARLQRSVLGKSGSLILTSIIFTLVHSQYQGIELFALFTFAILLGLIRIKTNNIKYCIAVHMINNVASLLALYWLN